MPSAIWVRSTPPVAPVASAPAGALACRPWVIAAIRSSCETPWLVAMSSSVEPDFNCVCRSSVLMPSSWAAGSIAFVAPGGGPPGGVYGRAVEPLTELIVMSSAVGRAAPSLSPGTKKARRGDEEPRVIRARPRRASPP
jgi:hypothetical protein